MLKNQRNKTHKNEQADLGQKENLSTVRGWLGEATNEWYNRDRSDRDRETNGGLPKPTPKPRPIRQSSSAGHLSTLGRSKEVLNDSPKVEHKQMQLTAIDIPYEKKIKRTKSLWKFRKSEEVLEGMALWKHRSLVDVSGVVGKDGNPLLTSKTLSVNKDSRENSSPDGEDLSEETIVNGERKESNLNNLNNVSSKRRGSVESEESSDNTDDNESCIVVDDHHKAAKVANILPRTRLIRSSTKRLDTEMRNSETDLRMRPQRKLENRAQTTGDLHRPWFDPWENE